MINKIWILLSDQVRKSNTLVLVGLGERLNILWLEGVEVESLPHDNPDSVGGHVKLAGDDPD